MSKSPLVDKLPAPLSKRRKIPGFIMNENYDQLMKIASGKECNKITEGMQPMCLTGNPCNFFPAFFLKGKSTGPHAENDSILVCSVFFLEFPE